MHLSDYMRAQSLTDKQVAAEIGTSRATISRIRRGKMRPGWPTLEKLKIWSNGGISADDFIEQQAAQ